MGIVKDGRFWIGFLVGYFLLVIFPQLNIRVMGVKASLGKA
jgi:hypothetical protein